VTERRPALPPAEINGIVKAASEGDSYSAKSRWAADLGRFLSALPDLEFETTRATPLVKLCAAGAAYGWRELEKSSGADLLANLSAKASASLRRNLRSDLGQITQPCFDLEWKSFRLAVASIGLARKPEPKLVERMFLGGRPSHRLFSLFKKFPVLARLWSQLIRQWREHAGEVLIRFERDRRSLSRTFFANRRLGKISDTYFGLSDRHHSGRTVVRLQFETGSVIYKPRSGAGEREWFLFLAWVNQQAFRPKLRVASILPRRGYCWMDYLESASLRSNGAARRFYQRMGGIIAAAYLLRAVDCHRDNLVASGEQPVLVDVDALWHVSPRTERKSFAELIDRTGFFPNANRLSLQSRSSILGPGTAGNHLPRLAGKPLFAVHYQEEITLGFARAWRCILGTKARRNAFARRLRRIRNRERRWIYWSTEKYAAIREASLQPSVLRSCSERDSLIRRSCERDTVTSAVINSEVRALKALDIPYFVAKTDRRSPP
jgi:lantibiotic modifying enzyme